MAKLKFYYGNMFSGKTTYLCNTFDIYSRKGLKPVVIKPILDDREGRQTGWGKTTSRNGTSIPVYYYTDLKKELPLLEYKTLMVDEAQFLSASDISLLTDVVDEDNINVIAYGLKTDCNGNLFTGSAALLAQADEVEEIESLCQYEGCNKKAEIHVRFIDGHVDKTGQAVAIEKGDVTYRSVCRKHWKELTR